MSREGSEMTKTIRTALVAAVMLLGMAGVLLPTAASACGGSGQAPCDTSTETQYGNYGTCSVYANGGGMGSYCLSGGAALQTLRERFGNQVLQRCRWTEIPPGLPTPFNSKPELGRYMLQTCLGNIDFDTYAGGQDRTVNVNIVWVPNGHDNTIKHNGITDFLWKQVIDSAQLPVPFLEAKPNITPIVGVPTFFTFRWLDPGTNAVVRDKDGPYADRPGGGPFLQIVNPAGLVMRAEATKIVVNPNQKDMKAVECRPDTPYTEGASPAHQPAGACSITFQRSSASAHKFTTKEIPGTVGKRLFYTSVDVTWRITYGRPGDMRDLGTGFIMRVMQSVPVQEIQAANQQLPIPIY